jgi:putative endonuclease
MRDYDVYILASPSRTLYIGVTNSLVRRIWQHKEKRSESFTKRYNITLLVYYETFSGPRDAIAREKHLKNWTRAKKIALIETLNPDWLDLSAEWYR